jgi:hypothetical protein
VINNEMFTFSIENAELNKFMKYHEIREETFIPLESLVSLPLSNSFFIKEGGWGNCKRCGFEDY